MREKMEVLKMDRSFASRYVNDGFSGGEKKRAEVLQMALLEPQIAVLDETDSGLDIDALRIVSEGVNKLCWSRRGRHGHHPLPAHPQLHQAAIRARAWPTARSFAPAALNLPLRWRKKATTGCSRKPA